MAPSLEMLASCWLVAQVIALPLRLERLLLIVGVAIGAHIAVLIVQAVTRFLIGTGLGSINKAQTVTRFVASLIVFVIWFVALGYVLLELGVPLQTYIASATIIGLAVSFGSQSLVQDVISGLTLIFTGLIDVGDMVDIGGQVGVVEKIGIRYTELRNVQGATIFIPNRNVTNVINYPRGYIRAFVDVRLPTDEDLRERAAAIVHRITDAAHAQFTGIMIQPPSVNRMSEPAHPPPLSALEPRQDDEAGGEASEAAADSREPIADSQYIRIKFRIWPGQGGVIETVVRQRIIHSLRAIDSNYQDWMAAVHYRVEPAFTRRAVSALEALLSRRGKKTN